MKCLIFFLLICLIVKNEGSYISLSIEKINSFDSSFIYGNSSVLHYYYVNIYVGSEMSKQSLIIDTGSSLTGFPCKGFCNDCGVHLNPYYNHNDSISSKLLYCEDAKKINLKCDYCNNNNLCSYRQSYGEGSTYSGVFVEDKIYFGDNHNLQKGFIMPFGCHIKETNLFLTQLADGVLGLSPKEHRFSAFIKHLRNNSIISKSLFSLCLAPNSGVINLGGFNNSFHSADENIEYIDYKAEDLYKIELNEIRFGEYIINNKVLGGLDTGSTNTYFPKEIFDEFFLKLKEYCSSPDVCLGDILKINDEICFIKKKGISLEEFYDSMPVLNFFFKKFTLTWKSISYFYNNKDEEFCLSIHKWELNEIVFGSTWMHDYDIIFDMESNKIGFIKADCSWQSPTYIPGENREFNYEKISYFNTGQIVNYYMIIIIILSVLLIAIILIFMFALFRNRTENSKDNKHYVNEEEVKLHEEIDKSNKEIENLINKIDRIK